MTIMRGNDEKEGGELSISIENIFSDGSFCASHPDAEKGLNYHIIKVSDEGVGMDDETLTHVFEPFFTTKKLEEGSGLGLSTVYNLVRQHKGFISIYSEKGKGSIFNIFLPKLFRENSIEDVQTVDRNSLMGSGLILVVDDEEIMRLVAKEALEEYGYDVITADNGEECINIFRENYQKITAVLLDMCMPKISGKVAYSEMKKIDPEVKVLLTSGFRQDDEVQATIDLGVNGFIQKPYTGELLAEKIKKILNIEGVRYFV